MIGKINNEGEYPKVSYNCESLLQQTAKIEQVQFEKQKGQNQAEQENDCILQIRNYKNNEKQGSGQSQVDVIYKCYSNIKSFKEILEESSNEIGDKMRYFYQLIELTIAHKKQQITHLNIKPSNVILYNGRFYLIDFGYLKDKPADFVICLNYIKYKEHNDEQKRNLYPYLNDQLLTYIKENTNESKQKFEKMSQDAVQKQDRYALGVMMLELFVPFKNIYQNFEIDTCVDQAKNRKMQLEKIGESFENSGKSVVDKIKNIISYLLFKGELPPDKEVSELKEQFEECQRSLKNQQNLNLSIVSLQDSESDQLIGTHKKINSEQPQITLKEIMDPNNGTYVQDLIDQKIYQFDPNLFYYLNKQDLVDYCSKIRNLQNFKQNEKAKILNRYHSHYQDKESKKFNLTKMDDEDIYYIFHSIGTDQDRFEENIQEQIEKLNSIDPKEYKFNQINKGLTGQPYKKEYQQDIPIQYKEEIEQKQNIEQAKNDFEKILQNKIPNIMRFLEYKCLLDKELKYEFEFTKDENTGFLSAKEKKEQKYWNIFKNTEEQKKLFIGKVKCDPSEDFQGRVIEETKYQILDYNNVTYNLKQDKYSGKGVEVFIYNKFIFQLTQFYKGDLEDNKYHGEGFIKDWINNYEYEGNWKQGKKDGKQGKLKIINTEVLLQNEFSELSDVIYSDDYLKYGKISESKDQQKKPLKINFYFYETLKVYNCNEKYFMNFDCSKFCKILGSQFADKLRIAKNSLCNCKKAR
ncbi:unnamed protein product [Paramecium octaurelia]|uniref:Protein kinase domain-containing protein n=1 Tax=Paramecium octaurelia TaxID=43137 RepID=A0A8S1WE13_PAROT|nr:unnamed protein product [Paramecium octaurelia]